MYTPFPLSVLIPRKKHDPLGSQSMTRTVWALCLIFVGLMAFKARNGYIDYGMYERAAARVASGDWVNLYEPGRMEPPKFHYSYFFAWAFIPFAKLGPAIGQKVYFGLFAASFLFLLWGSVQLARRLVPDLPIGRSGAAEVTALLLVSYPASDAFITGNIGLPLAALMLAAYWLHLIRPWLSSAILGAAITLKIYPAFLVGYFVWAGRWKVAFLSLAFFFFFYLGVPALLEGPSHALWIVQAQWDSLAHFGDHWAMDSLYFQNIPAALMRWGQLFGIPWQKSYPFAVAAAVAVPVLLFLPSLHRTKSPEASVLGFILSFALVALVVPMGWINMGVFYTPLIFFCTRSAFIKDARAARIALGLFIVFYSLTTRDLIGTFWNNRLEYFSVPVIGIAVLICWLAGELRRKLAATTK